MAGPQDNILSRDFPNINQSAIYPAATFRNEVSRKGWYLIATAWTLVCHQVYRGADKSLALPGREQARKHVRDARDFNNIETRAVIKFVSLQGKAPKEIHAILTETLACFLPGRAKDLSSGVPRGGLEVQTPPPPKLRRPSKTVPNATRLWKLLKIYEFRTPTPQDVRKKGQ